MKKKLYSILEFLGLKQKFEDKTLSNEEFQSIVAEYQKKYKTTLQDDIAAEQQEEANQRMLRQIYDAVAAIGQESTSEEGEQTLQSNVSMEGVIAAINNLGSRFEKMASTPAEDIPAATSTGVKLAINGPGNTPQYLFGIENPMFDMKQRWNIIAANPRAARSMNDPDDETQKVFYKAVSNYGRSLQHRFAYLQQNAMLNAKLLETGEFSNNYDGVEGAGLGDQYVIRRQDALIARVLKKRDLTQYFPVRYGVQDRDLLFNTIDI